MTVIKAESVSVEFPIYGSAGRPSLKRKIISSAVGGSLKNNDKQVMVRALNDLSFEFHEGDRVGLIGHNGSGKSTLLRVLAGIYEPTSGTLEVRGRVTSMLSLMVGMDSEATGIENIYMRGYFMGLSKKKISTLIDEIVDFSEIGDYLYLPMRTYSSGMAMRLAFAVSTSVDSDIILMDEWLSVGDQSFIEKAEARLDSIVNNARIVVIASHDHSLIQRRCNKTLILNHGDAFLS